MSDERIDIVVNDKVDPSIASKIKQIQANAESGASSVAKLRAELASINASPALKLQQATDGATASINKQLNAQNALTSANAKSSSSNAKAASDINSVTAALDKETAAQQRLAAVVDRTIARQKVQGAANAGSALSQGVNPFQAEAAAAGAAAQTAAAATTAAEVQTVGSYGRIKNAALTTYDAVRDAGYAFAGKFNGFLGGGGAATVEKEALSVGKLGQAAAVNSVAIRELFVLGREASRGNFSRMAGSVSILASSLGLLYNVLIPLVAIVGIAAAGMKLFEESIRADADPQLKAYANTLGLTSKEMRKLGDDTVGAGGKLKEFNAVTLTFGDVWKGLGRTLEQDLGMKDVGTSIKQAMFDAAYRTVEVMGTAAAEIYAAFYATFATIKVLWGKMPGVFDAIGTQIANGISKIFEDMINDIIRELNKIDVKLRALFGMSKSIPTAYVHIERQQPGTDDGKVAQAMLQKTYNEAFATATQAERKFLADWKKNSIQAGKDRLKEMADAIKGNRNPKKETDPKTKEDYLNDTNKKLDDELSRMHLLKDAREEQQRLDQIEEEFAKRRQPLTQKEIEGFAAKIHAIQEFKYQQAEMDRIYDQFNGAQKTYTASLAASNDLLDRGAISANQYALAVSQANLALAKANDPTGASLPKFEYEVKINEIKTALENYTTTNGKFGISQQQAAEQTNIATLAFKEATDPLYAMNKAVDDATKLTGLYGDELAKATYLQQIQQAYEKAGKSIYDESTGALKAEVQALVDKNEALRNQTFIQSQVGSVVDPILQDQKMLQNKQAMYDELNRMADKYNLDEAHRAQARYALDLKFNTSRLQAMSDTFGQLATLSSSGNKKLAAIGKAAAIAQATIDGIMAVQKALASAPPPFNVIEAGVIAVMTGVNVAKIISTPVGGYANGGSFMVDGKAGVDQNNINMNVSRGERVTIETPAQQRRANDASGAPPVFNAKIVNQFDAREFVSAMDTDEGEALILNTIRRNPDAIRAALPPQ